MFLYCVKALNASYLVLRSRRNPWQHPTARLIEFLCVSAVSSLLVAAMPRCEGVNELLGRGVPLLGEEGWLRHQENAAKPPYEGRRRGGQSRITFQRQHVPIMTTPSAPLRRLRVFFLLAQPPLLFQEGNTLSCNSFTPSKARVHPRADAITPVEPDP